METNPQISHKGHVVGISEGKALVSIASVSACASCSVKGQCSASDMQEKTIEARLDGQELRVGQEVEVFFDQSLGFRALLLGYLYPFGLLMAVLLVALAVTDDEIFSGVLAMASLLPYYLGLKLSGKRLGETFQFSVRKTSREGFKSSLS